MTVRNTEPFFVEIPDFHPSSPGSDPVAVAAEESLRLGSHAHDLTCVPLGGRTLDREDLVGLDFAAGIHHWEVFVDPDACLIKRLVRIERQGRAVLPIRLFA